VLFVFKKQAVGVSMAAPDSVKAKNRLFYEYYIDRRALYEAK